MYTTTVPQRSDGEYAGIVCRSGRGLFQSKHARDCVARLLKQQGHNVTRSSVRGQRLHPEYVTDYVGTLEIGFGNSQYQMFWPVLYQIEVM